MDWARGHLCYILLKYLDSFCPCPENMIKLYLKTMDWLVWQEKLSTGGHWVVSENAAVLVKEISTIVEAPPALHWDYMRSKKNPKEAPLCEDSSSFKRTNSSLKWLLFLKNNFLAHASPGLAHRSWDSSGPRGSCSSWAGAELGSIIHILVLKAWKMQDGGEGLWILAEARKYMARSVSAQRPQ